MQDYVNFAYWCVILYFPRSSGTQHEKPVTRINSAYKTEALH